MIDKRQLRERLLARRTALSNAEVAYATGRITTTLIREIDWEHLRTVHVYTSMIDWKEIGTTDIIQLLQELCPNVSLDTSESVAEALRPTVQYDAIIVPVLGFDSRGYRLGLGKGWYDRFLATQTHARKIGIAYSWAEVEAMPQESHDVPLDIIVTEKNMFVCGAS